MTDLNTTNFQETVNNALQEALNTKSRKTSILLWTNHSPKYPNSFILKKEGKKYLGLSRTDKRGETYWSFKEIGRKRSENEVCKNLVSAKQNNKENANNSNSSE